MERPAQVGGWWYRCTNYNTNEREGVNCEVKVSVVNEKFRVCLIACYNIYIKDIFVI